MMSAPIFWIVAGGLLMSAIAAIGGLTLALGRLSLDRLLLPLVAFAAGALLGGAFFHMIPAAVDAGMAVKRVGFGVAVGFTAFFALEQLLQWRHCKRAAAADKQPLTWLILIGDALHNFLGGLAIGGIFLVDIRLGITSWLAAAAHEVPQELGDFAVLVHGGWSRPAALLFNVLSGLTFLAGGLVAWGLSRSIDVTWLIPVAAGNFLYIGASDLVPEIKRGQDAAPQVVPLIAFATGLALLWVASAAAPG
jgi:zinc and cadmium transporter